MRSAPISVGGLSLVAVLTFFLTCPDCPLGSFARADTFSLEGRTIEGEIVDLVEDGAFVSAGSRGEVIPWENLTSFQARDVRTERITELRNLRTKAVWIIGTVREVFPEGAVIYADGRRRADYGATFNVPELKDGEPRPRGTRCGAPAVSGWYLVADLPDSERLMDETVELIAYPDGNIEELQLAEENDPEKIPTTTLALPAWSGVRTWTNTEGVELEAELVYVLNGNCVFEKQGQTLLYPAEKLSAPDRELVKQCEDFAREVFLDATATR